MHGLFDHGPVFSVVVQIIFQTGCTRALFRALILALLGHYAWRSSSLPFPSPPPPTPQRPGLHSIPPPYWRRPQTGSKTVPVLDSVKDRVLRKLLRAPMERLKDQKADQNRLSPGTSFGDRSLQRFRLHRGGPQVSAHSIQILQPNSVPMRGGRRRILTDILQRHAPPCRALAPALLWPIEHQVCLK